jgi:hypothetical protein
MLYSITIQDDGRTVGAEPHFEEWIVEAPGSRWVPSQQTAVLPHALREWIEEKAREASIRWEVEVDVEVAHYFPARIGMPKDNGSCVRSVLAEFKRFYRRQDHLVAK